MTDIDLQKDHRILHICPHDSIIITCDIRVQRWMGHWMLLFWEVNNTFVIYHWNENTRSTVKIGSLLIFGFNKRNGFNLLYHYINGSHNCTVTWDPMTWDIGRIYIYNGSVIQYWRSCTPLRSIGLYFWGVRGSWAECHFLFSLVYQLCLAHW